MNQSFSGDFSLLDSQQNSKFITSLIILNSPINSQLLATLVSHSQKIILADGGANQYYNTIKNHQLVDCIVGDLDSIQKSVLEYYREKGVKVFEMQDQDSTDLEKAINRIQRKEEEGTICIVGGNGNRTDHNIGIYSILTRTGREFKNSEVFLINNFGIIMYLKPNKQYKIKMSKFETNKSCGVITFGKVNLITTKGLKWDMGKDQFVSSLEFGGTLSTSNQRISEEVQILVSDEAFWVTHMQLPN